jgi:hypothetical protein
VDLALFVHLHSASCLWFCVQSLCDSKNGKGNLKRCCGTNIITSILQFCLVAFYIFILVGGCSAACYQNVVNVVFQMDSSYY